MAKDGLRRLPDHVVPPLLRALESLPAPGGKLILRRAEYSRMPGHDQRNDYDVIWCGRTIGRVWRHHYQNHPWRDVGLWHWHWDRVPGRPGGSGHGPTLESVLADFRRVWDARESGVA